MTWTYSSTSGLDRDYVRLRIGDTVTADPLLTDEEIAALVTNEGDKHLAAAAAADTLAAQFARKVDKTVGKLSISNSQAFTHFSALAKRLRSEITMTGGLYAGGISVSDKNEDKSDSDRVDPAFFVGQFEYPGSVDWST